MEEKEFVGSTKAPDIIDVLKQDYLKKKDDIRVLKERIAGTKRETRDKRDLRLSLEQRERELEQIERRLIGKRVDVKTIKAVVAPAKPVTPEVRHVSDFVVVDRLGEKADELFHQLQRAKHKHSILSSIASKYGLTKEAVQTWYENRRVQLKSNLPKAPVTSEITKLEQNLMGLTEKEIVELVNPVKVKLARDLGLYYGRTDTAASIRAIDFELLKARREALTKRGCVLPRHKAIRITPKTPRLQR